MRLLPILLVLVAVGLAVAGFQVSPGLGGAVLASLAITVVVVVGGAVLAERNRRRLADSEGFARWLARGAPHLHPRLIEALVDGLSDRIARAKPVEIGTLDPGADGLLLVGDPSAAMENRLDGLAPLEWRAPGPLSVRGLRIVAGQDQRLGAVALLAPGADLAATRHLEPAWAEGEREWAAEGRMLPRCGTDSATLAFGPPAAWAAVAERIASGAEPGSLLAVEPGDGTNPYLAGAPDALWRWLETDGGPLMLVLPGDGDGNYPLWLARDAQGRVLGLVADFLLMEEEAERYAYAGPY